jgi:hypothetical protein
MVIPPGFLLPISVIVTTKSGDSSASSTTSKHFTQMTRNNTSSKSTVPKTRITPIGLATPLETDDLVWALENVDILTFEVFVKKFGYNDKHRVHNRYNDINRSNKFKSCCPQVHQLIKNYQRYKGTVEEEGQDYSSDDDSEVPDDNPKSDLSIHHHEERKGRYDLVEESNNSEDEDTSSIIENKNEWIVDELNVSEECVKYSDYCFSKYDPKELDDCGIL